MLQRVRSLLATVVFTLLAHEASAANFTVSNTFDFTVGSLRQAVLDANAAGGTNTITFDAAIFASGEAQSFFLSGSLPDVTCNLTITGPGAKLAIVSGDFSNRCMRVTAGKSLTVSGLTFQNFYVQGATGANGVNAGTPPTAGADALGGVIWNSGSLTVSDCYFSTSGATAGSGGRAASNIAQNGAAGGSAKGGAIYSDGTALSIVRSTINGCSASGGSGGAGADIQFGGGGSGNGAPGGAALGGAVYVSTGTASIVNSTIMANNVGGGTGGNGGASNFGGAERPGGAGGDAQGGGIFASPAVTLTACTIVKNSLAPGQGGLQTDFSQYAAGGVGRGGGVLATALITIGNTIVAKNTAQNPVTFAITPEDVFGGFTSANFNFIGAADGATGFAGAADQKGTAAAAIDPNLSYLVEYLGTAKTPVLRLRRGSPAVDKGNKLGLTTDQTGSARPVDLANGTYPNAAGGDGSDIGAFESQTLPNDVPVAYSGLNITGTKGVALSGQALQGFDGDGDTLTYSLANGSTMPAGLTLNSDGTVIGTCNIIGQTLVQYQVTDPAPYSATSAPGSFYVFINEPGSLVVTTTADVTNPLDGFTSLREAIVYASTLGGTQNITFDATVFAKPETIVLDSSINTANDFTLTGPAAGVTIDGANTVQLFRVGNGTVNFSKLTFARGAVPPSSGGGALYIGNGTVSATNCTFTQCGSFANFSGGGAIRNFNGALTLTNCTLAGNYLSGSNSYGGAIYQDAGTATVLNCTITDNDNVAFANATGDGGGIRIAGGTFSIGNTIVTANTADQNPDISGSFTSLGFNLIGSTTGATFTPATTDLIGANTLLDPTGLGFNGGPVQTIAFTFGSAAQDAGKRMGGATTDARGLATYDSPLITNATGGDGSDIGAFEAQAFAPEIAVEDNDAVVDLRNGGSRDLGTVDVGVGKVAGFRLRNKGVSALLLSGNPIVTISGTNAAEFSVPEALVSQMTGGQAQTFSVVCTAASTGAKSALLTITSNDADEGAFTIALTAQAVDTVTAPPTITSPTNGGAVFPMADVSFILPEAAQSGTVKLTFDNGTAYDFPLDATNETAGSHSVTRDTAAAGMTPGDYSLTLSYQDAAGHGAATMTIPVVHVRPAKAVSTKFIAAGGTAPDAAPGAGVFPGLPTDATLASFNPPAIDDAGNIAYFAKWASKTGGANGKPTKGAGLFRNNECLALIGGDASALFGTGVTWKSFTDPVVSDGKVVFIATLSGVKTGTSAIVGTALGGGLEMIARAGEPAAGASVGGATFKTFKAVTVEGPQAFWRLAFLAQLTNGTGTPKVTAANDMGIWFYEPHNPLFVMREGDEVAGHKIKTLVSFLPGNGSPGCGRGTLTDNGDGIITALALFTDKTQGLIQQNIDDGPPSLKLSLSGDTDTGVNNGATFASYGVPARNNAQTAAFLAKLTIGGGVTKADASGIFTGPDVAGQFRTVVRSGVNAGQAGSGAKFGLLKDPVLSSDGDIAFSATVTGVKGPGAQTLWLRPASGGLTLLAQGGADAGDLPGAKFKAFTSLAIAGGGRGPIFAATLTPNKTNVAKTSATGVWGCDFTGAVRLLFRTDDEIDFGGGVKKKVKSFTVLKASVGSTGVTRSFNDAAQVVWVATFTDKTQAIVTTEVP